MKEPFGNRIRELRTEARFSQAELARKLGISPSAIGMYEQNRRVPSHELLLKLCELFGVSSDYLLGKTDAVQSRDVSDMLDEFTKKLCEQEGLMFDGNPLNETEKRKIVEAIKEVSRIAEQMKGGCL